MKTQAQFQAAFDAFMNTEAEDAIIISTQGGYAGPEDRYSVELFDDGAYRVLWNGHIGNLYRSPGIMIEIPELDSEEINDDEPALSYFDDALDLLREKFESVFDE